MQERKMAKSEAEEWLILWASDNMHDGYTANASSIDEAVTACLSAAEEDRLSPSAVIEAAGGDLAGYLRNFKMENPPGV
jgi:hypothetical protein